MGVGDAVIAAAENTVAEDAAGAQRNFAPLLLVDDVLPDSFAGGPARFVFRATAAAEMAPMIYFQLKPAENIMQQAMMP